MAAKEDTHLGRHILKIMEKNENKIHQIEWSSGAIDTFGSTRLKTIRLAQWMKLKGFKKGNVVAIIGTFHNEASIAYLAGLYIGVISLGLNAYLQQNEMIYIIRMCKPKMVFIDEELLDSFSDTLLTLNLNIEIICFGKNHYGYKDFSDILQPTGLEEFFVCDQFNSTTTTAILVCTSGTTDQPKLVAYTHKSLYMNINVYRKYLLEAQDGDYIRVYTVSSLHWISGCVNLLASVSNGYSLVHSRNNFSPNEFQGVAERYQPTSTTLTPAAVKMLIEYNETNKIDFSSFRLILVGGTTYDYTWTKKLQTLVPNGLVANTYGMTEIFCITGSIGDDEGACGKIHPMIKYKVVSIKNYKKVGPNELGELYLKSPYMFQEYYNNPEATAATYDSDGWFKTGDMVKVNEENVLYCIDRKKQIVKYRMKWVLTSELETVIQRIPGVLSVGVVGRFNLEDGERPCAFVKIDPNSNITEQRIKDEIRYKCPNHMRLRGGVIFVSQMPMTQSGKINKMILKNMINSK